MFTAAVITISDRSSAGLREDLSGPCVEAILTQNGYHVSERVLIPDDQPLIEQTLQTLADDRRIALIVTTGGTGFSPRDVTPEATLAVCERRADGIPEAMRAASMAVTPRAMLSRAAAGIRGTTLIVNVPGSPKAAAENLNAVIDTLAHGLAMLRGGLADCAAGS